MWGRRLDTPTERAEQPGLRVASHILTHLQGRASLLRPPLKLTGGLKETQESYRPTDHTVSMVLMYCPLAGRWQCDIYKEKSNAFQLEGFSSDPNILPNASELKDHRTARQNGCLRCAGVLGSRRSQWMRGGGGAFPALSLAAQKCTPSRASAAREGWPLSQNRRLGVNATPR